MDPTAPRDNSQNPNTPQGSSTPPPTASGPDLMSGETPSPANAWSPIEQPQSGGPQPTLNPDGAGPILPGQFVVSGQNSPSQPQNTQIPQQPTGIDNTKPLPSMQADAQSIPNPINHTLDNINVQDQLITPPAISPDPVSVPPGSAAVASQPDPTPYVAPTNQTAPGGFSKPSGGGIKKLRSLILILGIIILLIIIGAIAWFFFFSNQANQAAKTESQDQSAPILEQQPIPKRGDGGFEKIQESATPSGQLQPSTPPAPAVPTP